MKITKYWMIHLLVFCYPNERLSPKLREKILDFDLHRLEATEETWKLACKFLEHKHSPNGEE